MIDYTQQNRFASISDFSLGEDTFLLRSLSGSEHISGLFQFDVIVVSENLEMDPLSVVGKDCTIKIHNDVERCFHAYVTHFSHGEVNEHNLREYRLTLSPWLWFLSQTNNNRIYQNKTAKDIISEIFQDHGFIDFDFRAQGGTAREYCVQYNESDLQFVSRLLEEEGIAYYFVHEEAKHTLILVDTANAYEEVKETDLSYSKGSSDDVQLSRWEHSYAFKKGMWSFSDFNYEDPNRSLNYSAKTVSKFANVGKFEHYEYPSLYDFTSGADLVEKRMEAEEADIDTVSGDSQCSSFYAGGKFTVEKHDSDEQTGEYILTSVFHSLHVDSYTAGESGGEGYTNSFVGIPSRVHFRPKRITPRPTVRGPQSAMVTGPAGEEIYVDDLGRIKVQFHWDRDGENDENTTCFIRVMQAWAGAQWGASFIPRIGHEVIIDFLNGDPDKPIVTGSVYNGLNRPPFDSKTQSGIRTRSTKEGDGSHCNELRFDDKMGSEQVYIHAEKNLDTEVENDQSLTVDNDRIKLIKNDEVSTIEHDRTKEVKNDQSEKIGNNKKIDVTGNHTENVGGNVTLSVSGNQGVNINKSATLDIAKDLSETISGNHTQKVSKDYKVQASTITMQADKQITLKTGSAQIVMKSNGDITISGKNINVKGSGKVALKGSSVTQN